MYIRKPFLDRVAFNKKNILRRDGYTCQYCNRRGERLTVDHIVPRSRGGRDDLDQRGGRVPALQSRARATGCPTRWACDSSASRCTRSSCSRRTCSATRTRTRSSIPGGSTCVAVPDACPGVAPTGPDVPAGRRSISRAATSRRPSRRLTAPRPRGAAARRAARGDRVGQDLHDGQRDRRTSQRPTLVISPNKTLAAQLFGEFRPFFPRNAVEYFVSYYDYYQPEAYIPQSDTYIEKDALDQRRDRPHAALRHQVAAWSGATWWWSPRSRASTASARPRPIRGMHSRSARASGSTATRSSAGWWPCSTSATTTTSTAGRSACAATWSRSSPPTRRRSRSGSSCSATWWRPCTGSIP